MSLAPLRTSIDGFLEDAYEALVKSLRKSVTAETDAVQKFVSESGSVLSTRATSTEELASLSVEFHRLLKESNQVSFCSGCTIKLMAQ